MSELFKNIRKVVADAAQNKEQRVAELKAQGLNTAGGQSTAGKTFRQVQQKNANKMTDVRQKAQERQNKVTYNEIMRRGDASPARQKLLAQQEAASKWYQGDTPTSSEALARIYTIAQEDSARAEQLYNAYIGFTQDASTPFYNPYSTATNKASAALSELGYDMSGGITKEWLEENSYLKNYYRTSDTGTNPLSPTKSSSNEQDAAYWWYQAYKAEETTEQAETEWQALQEEIAYWTNRTDRNYTDDEILAKIDWSNYKTLVKMDEGKDSGVPLTLNRSVGYSQDALKGVIWAARNGSTGSTQNDSVKAVLGAGKSYTEMQPVRRKLDATSEYYSPYSVGCTMDDEALYFGVSRFGEDWLEENKSILNGNDATAKQMYQNVYAAEQTTLQAEAELEELQAKVDNLLKYSSDPDKILAAVDGEYKTLEKLDESMQTGKLLDTTRRINYSKGDLERYVRNKCALANAAATGKEFASTVKKVLGVGASIVKATSLGDGRDNAINAAGTTIAEAGTDAEKTAFDTAYSADFGTYVDEVNSAITNGDVNGQEMYEYSQQRADKQAATEGLDAYATVKTYETAVTDRDAAIKELEEKYGIYVDEDGNIDTTRMQSTEPKTSGFVKDVNLNNAKTIASGGGSDAGLGSNPFAVGGYDMSAGELEIQKKKLAELQADLNSGKYRDINDITRVQNEIYTLQKEISKNEAKQEEAQNGDAQATGKKKKPGLQTQLTAVDLTEEQQKEVNKLLNAIDEANETINGTQEEYDKAQETLKQIEDGYAAANAIADMTGAAKYDTSAMQIIESIAPIATEYVPTEWRSGNLFSLIMDYYGGTYEQTAEAAKDRIKANQAEIDAVNKAREELEKLGVDIGADLGVDYDNNLKRYVADLERDNKDAEYFLLGENEDFEEVVSETAGAVDSAYAKFNQLDYYSEGIANWFSWDRGDYSSTDDAVMLQLEKLNEGESQDPNKSAALQNLIDGKYQYVQFLDKQECETYLYLRGTQGEKAAQEYYDYLTDDTYGQVVVRASEERREWAAEFAKENPTISTALAIVSAPLTGIMSVAESVKGSLFAEEVNPYGAGYVGTDFSSTVKSTVTQDIKDNVREWAADKLSNLDVGGIKVNLSDDAVEWGAEALSWLAGASYQAGVSIGESTVYAGLLGGAGASVGAKASAAFQALGMSEKGASLLGGVVRSAVGASGQGASAAATAVQEAKLKGASDTDAQLMGGVTFIAETITEAIELETLTEAFELGGEAGKTMIERAVKTAFSGLNEAVGEGASSLIESWGDYAIMGINSDYEQKVKEYEEQGYRLDDARKAAMSDVLMDALESSAVGFISGEIGGVTGQLAGYGNNQLDLQNRINDRAAQNTQTNVQSEQANVQNQQTAQTQYQERSMQQQLTVQDEAVQNAATIAQDGQSIETDNAVQESTETATNENTAEETQTFETVEQIDEAIAQKQTEVNKASRKVQSLERQLRNSRSSKTQQSLIDATSEMRRANTELQQLQQQRTEIEQRQASKPSIQTPLTVQDETTAQESTAQENTQTEQPKRQMQERATVQDAETTQADSTETAQQETNQTAESNQTAAQETQSNRTKRQMQQPATMLDESRAKRMASEITTLQIAMTEADSSSMTATIGAILTEDAGNLTEKDAASAAAQNLVHRYGAKEMGNATLKMILYDNGDITGTKEALTVAGLYPNGKANSVLQEIMWNDVTAETVTELREAAMEDLTQPDADAVIDQNIHDSRVANDVVKQAGEGAFNGVQPYEDAVTKRKIEKRQAENMLRQARQRLSDLRQNFVSIQQQFLNDPTNGSLMGAFASTLKDVEGQTKVVQEYEQSLTNAEQSLTEAQKQLDQKRDETVTNVRRQAEANVAEQDVQRTAEIAQRQAEEAAAQRAQENAQVTADSAETVQTAAENNAENAQAADIETAQPSPDATKPQQSSPDIQPVYAGQTTRIADDTKANKNQPVQGKVYSPIETMQTLCDELGVGVTQGSRKMSFGKNKLSKGVLGYYVQKYQNIVTKRGQASNYAVSMHEAGHAIADQIHMTGTEEMIDALDPTFRANYTMDVLPDEAFAEFVSMYMQDSERAVNFAGRAFVNQFESQLKNHGLADAVHTARDRIQTYIASSAVEKAQAAIVRKSDTRKKGTMAERLTNFMTQNVSWSYALEQVDKKYAEQHDGEYSNLRTYAKTRNFADEIAKSIMTDTYVTPDKTPNGMGSFASCFEGIKGVDADNFITYWLMNHALDRNAQGKTVFGENISNADLIRSIDSLDALHPEYRTAMNRACKWWQNFMEDWVVGKYLPEESWNQMKKMYPHYLPTQRAVGTKSGNGVTSSSQKTFNVRAAVGSDLQIINPMEAIGDYVNQIVNMDIKNDACQQFHKIYQETEGLGIWARPINPDMVKTEIDLTDVQEKVTGILLRNDIDGDVMDQILQAVGDSAVTWLNTKNSTEGNVMRVVMDDGSIQLYQFDDNGKAIFDALTGNGKGSTLETNIALRALGGLTRFMSAMNTSLSHVFLASNAIRDFQTSNGYGSYGATFIDAAIQWGRAFYNVARNTEAYQNYKAMGGGGWNRINTNTRQGSDSLMNDLFKDYWKNSTKGRVKHAAGIAFNILTMGDIQEIVENTTKFAQFQYGKGNDMSTKEGRIVAFQKAQDVSVDFHDSGNGQFLAVLRSIWPFLNPSIQGTARAASEVSGRNRAEFGKRMVKRAVNLVSAQAICWAARMAFGSDEEKEAYKNLSTSMKVSNFIFFGAGSGSDRRMVRIPSSQDAWDQIVMGTAEIFLDGLSGDSEITDGLRTLGTSFLSQISLGLSDVLLSDGEIPERLNSLMSSTTFGALWGASTNLNYYGGKIESDYLKDLPASQRYDETTGRMFVTLGQAFGMSPKMLEYLYNQYTGYGGQLLVAATNGENVWDTITNSFHKRFTIDSAYTNDIGGAYDDNEEFITQLTKCVSYNGNDGGMLRGDLTDDERTAAYEEAKAMTKKGGIIYETNETIKALWTSVNKAKSDEDLTDAERNTLILSYRDQMVEAQLTANEAISEFNAKYVTGESWLVKLLKQPSATKGYSDYDKLEDTFKADRSEDGADNTYMDMAYSTWEAIDEKDKNRSNALPHPNTSFDSNKVTYEIEEADWDDYVAAYKGAYQSYLASYSKNWSSLSTEEQRAILKDAHSSGHAAAKKQYVEWYNQTHEDQIKLK